MQRVVTIFLLARKLMGYKYFTNVHRTVYPHVMSASEDISHGALQWIWLTIKFVTSQELEILPHFLSPCTTCVYLVMSVLVCLLISAVEVNLVLFYNLPHDWRSQQVCITAVMPLILVFKEERAHSLRIVCSVGMYVLCKLFMIFFCTDRGVEGHISNSHWQGLPVHL